MPWTLSKAEGIYHQLMAVAPHLPDNVRVIIGLKPLNEPSELSDQEDEGSNNETVDANGRSNSFNSDDGSITLGISEVSFERSLNLSYM